MSLLPGDFPRDEELGRDARVRGLKLLAAEDVASAESMRSGEPCETSLRANTVPIFGRRRRRLRLRLRRRRRRRR